MTYCPNKRPVAVKPLSDRAFYLPNRTLWLAVMRSSVRSRLAPFYSHNCDKLKCHNSVTGNQFRGRGLFFCQPVTDIHPPQNPVFRFGAGAPPLSQTHFPPGVPVPKNNSCKLEETK